MLLCAGWLLTTCTNPVAASNAKLALFYDWLFFDAEKVRYNEITHYHK
jgi:hypothetical protein